MHKEFKFRRGRILLGLTFFVLQLLLYISFLLNPEIYIRNVFIAERGIQIIGIIGFIYSSAVVFSFVSILPRKRALRITDEFLVDHSKYESLGKISWKDIISVQRLKKNNVEVSLHPVVFKSKKSNLVKRFLRFMHNWNPKKSILISSALLDVSIEELFETILLTYEKNKLK
ncbi:MAG: STM3941 family protein [Saprospiraceae bacterium]